MESSTPIKHESVTDPASPEQKAEDPKLPHAKAVFLWNALTFLALGFLVCLWAQYYTDDLPEIASLLGSGGALVWIAAGLGMLKPKRKEQAQEWFDTTILGSRIVSVVLMLMLVGLGFASTRFGSVQVQSVAEEPDHSVQVRRLGTQSQDWLHLVTAEHVRQLVKTSWSLPAKVIVKVKGYPEKVVEIRPLHRVSVYVPNSVRAPVILFRPRIAVMDAARPGSPKDPALLSLQVVTTDSSGVRFEQSVPFDGHPILLGTDEDIAIPAELEQRWQAEAKAAGDRTDALELWKQPLAPETFAVALTPKQEVTVTLKMNRDHSNYAKPQRFFVKPLYGSSSFVQEVVLNGP
jgi:hypothetical protein